MPVVPMTLISCALMVVVSLLTRPPSAATIARYYVSHWQCHVLSAKCQVELRVSNSQWRATPQPGDAPLTRHRSLPTPLSTWHLALGTQKAAL